MPGSGKTHRTIIWAIVALVALTLASIVLLALFYTGDSLPLITLVLSAVTPTITVLAAMRQVETVRGEVSQVRADTHALTNGLLDSKVRAGVAEVLPDQLVDPEYRAGQHLADQVAVENGHTDAPR